MTDPSYAHLLEDLRRDLQLNPSTDLLPFAVASAQNLPWKIDAGRASITWTGGTSVNSAVIRHRIGQIPFVVPGPNIGVVSCTAGVFNVTATSFTIQLVVTPVQGAPINGTITTVDWYALG